MNKNIFFYRVLMWQLMWRGQNDGATWQRIRTTRVTHVYMCARVSARVCGFVCMKNEIAPFLGFLLSH